MKISQLIKHLEEEMFEHGDVPVKFCDSGNGYEEIQSVSYEKDCWFWDLTGTEYKITTRTPVPPFLELL